MPQKVTSRRPGSSYSARASARGEFIERIRAESREPRTARKGAAVVKPQTKTPARVSGGNGRGRIRTCEGISHQIYSLTPLATWVHARRSKPTDWRLSAGRAAVSSVWGSGCGLSGRI